MKNLYGFTKSECIAERAFNLNRARGILENVKNVATAKEKALYIKLAHSDIRMAALFGEMIKEF